MKLRTRLLSLLLAGLMLFSLTACSGKDANEPSADTDPAVTDSASGSLLPEDFVINTAAQDICLETTGIPGDFELFTVNGVPVTTHYYLYWLSYVISYIESSMASYGVTIDWSSDPTFAQYAIDDALSACVQYTLVAAKAKELGFDMTQEQIDELESTLAQSIESMGGEEAFQEELRKIGLDYDTFYNINASSYYQLQLRNGLFPEPPTAEEIDAYIEEEDLLYAKHILLLTVDSTTRQPLDDETIAQKKATAEDVLSQLRSSADPAADFDALMYAYSEDPGVVTNPEGYYFTAGEMVTEFETATRELEFGQISDIVECASTGYHIILRLDPDTETTRAEYLSHQMSEQLALWTSEADIVLTEEYENFDMPLFYEKYVAYQQAFAAEEAAASEAE